MVFLEEFAVRNFRASAKTEASMSVINHFMCGAEFLHCDAQNSIIDTGRTWGFISQHQPGKHTVRYSLRSVEPTDKPSISSLSTDNTNNARTKCKSRFVMYSKRTRTAGSTSRIAQFHIRAELSSNRIKHKPSWKRHRACLFLLRCGFSSRPAGLCFRVVVVAAFCPLPLPSPE